MKTKETSKVICNQCGKPKEGVQTGLCKHCGRFGKRDGEVTNKVIKPNQVQWEKESHYNDEDLTDSQIESLIKPNQVQFKEFNEDLFKAYINKFSDEDKLKAIKVLLKSADLYLLQYYSQLDGDSLSYIFKD